MNKNVRLLLALSLALLSLSSCKFFFSTFSSGSGKSHAERASEYAAQGDLNKAVAEYEAHMQERLKNPRRPPDENPYFYHLLIGDLYLERDRPEDAKAQYLLAKSHNVEQPFVIDRLRLLAKWYSSKQRYEEAITIAEQYRDLDPLVFDADIDEFHKQLISAEDRPIRSK